VSPSLNQAPTPEIGMIAAPTAASETATSPAAAATSRATPAPVTPGSVPGSAASGNTFASTKHHYTVSYPANWTVNVQAGGAGRPGRDPEDVYFLPSASASKLPLVAINALKGAPPITGFENCDKNLVFRGIPACSLSIPKGQQPAQQLLIFQKGDVVKWNLRARRPRTNRAR
jgi:hypothetical protein